MLCFKKVCELFLTLTKGQNALELFSLVKTFFVVSHDKLKAFNNAIEISLSVPTSRWIFWQIEPLKPLRFSPLSMQEWGVWVFFGSTKFMEEALINKIN